MIRSYLIQHVKLKTLFLYKILNWLLWVAKNTESLKVCKAPFAFLKLFVRLYITNETAFSEFFKDFKDVASVENSYRPVARGYLS